MEIEVGDLVYYLSGNMENIGTVIAVNTNRLIVKSLSVEVIDKGRVSGIVKGTSLSRSKAIKYRKETQSGDSFIAIFKY